MQVALIAGIAIGIVSVLFALQNTTEVAVRFLAWGFEGSLALVLLLTLGLGALVAGLLSTPTVIRSQWTAARLARRVAELEHRLEKQERRNTERELALADHLPDGNLGPTYEPDAERPYVGLRALIGGAGQTKLPGN
jgi:uncharacterized integral membrane protein